METKIRNNLRNTSFSKDLIQLQDQRCWIQKEWKNEANQEDMSVGQDQDQMPH